MSGNAAGSNARRRVAAAGVTVFSLVAACAPEASPGVQPRPACAEGGELVASVYGAVEGRLDWRGTELECEGMPRPNGKGARLRFAGPAVAGGDADRLAFIVALPELEPGMTGRELAAGITLMEVGAGRFFSTPELPACWADIERQEPVARASGEGAAGEYRISGLLYCVSPLAELNGNAHVSLGDLRFSGRLDWSAPK